jgi:4-amino-4-deoxy-L-arabinose transferase-like glycosyltransferase
MKEVGTRAILREHVLLGIVFIALTFSTVAWTLVNRTLPSWDPADHMRTAYDFYRPLSLGRIAEFFGELFRAPHPYGPLYHWITAGIFLIAGVSPLTGIAANFAALAVLLISVNWIGDMLHPSIPDNRSSTAALRPGVLAAMLTVCYHFPAWLLHEAFLDYLLMAMVALAFALMMRAGDFHVRSDAILFGVVAGLGMLAKQTFPFFFILPGMVLCCRAWIRRDGRAIVNLALSTIVATLIASIWYVPHLNDVVGIYRVNALNATVENEAPAFSFRFLSYYWGVLGGLQIQLLFSILFVSGLTYSIRHRARQDWMLYLWILSGILSFTLLANKDTRYTVPILPAVALLSVSWLDRIRMDRRMPAAAVIVAWAFVSFCNAQWPSPKVDFRFSALGMPLYFLSGNVYRFDHRPLSEDWSIPEIVHTATGKLGVAPNIWQLNPSNVELYARIKALQVSVVWLSEGFSVDSLNQCDYVLARTHLENAERVEPMERKVVMYLSEHPDRFVPVATYALPYDQEAVLYRRKSMS